MNTPIEKQAEILAELWMSYRDEEYFKSFFEYADLGFATSIPNHQQCCYS